MKYEYKCTNIFCDEYDHPKEFEMEAKFYSESALPKCQKCKEPTQRIFSPFGLKSAGDGYKI